MIKLSHIRREVAYLFFEVERLMAYVIREFHLHNDSFLAHKRVHNGHALYREKIT